MWDKNGYVGLSYDIQLEPSQDITGRSGFFQLLELGLSLLGRTAWLFWLIPRRLCCLLWLCTRGTPKPKTQLNKVRLLPGALVMGGPPCSLYVWLSCSVHRRNLGMLEFLLGLARLIWLQPHLPVPDFLFVYHRHCVSKNMQGRGHEQLQSEAQQSDPCQYSSLDWLHRYASALSLTCIVFAVRFRVRTSSNILELFLSCSS